MNNIRIRTITSSLKIDYESSENDINVQLKKILNQISVFNRKGFEIKTLRINIVFNEKISITSLPSLINKLVFIESSLNLVGYFL